MARIEPTHLNAWRTLLRTQSLMVGAVEDALARHGLPALAWYDVLLPLHDARRPLRVGELAAQVVTIGRTGLTRLVDRLEAAGLVTRAHCKDDRRGVEITITPDGVALLAKMWPVYASVLQEAFVSRLDSKAAALLTELLERIASPVEPQA